MKMKNIDVIVVILLLCILIKGYCVYSNDYKYNKKEMYNQEEEKTQDTQHTPFIPPVELIPSLVQPQMHCPWKRLCLKC